MSTASLPELPIRKVIRHELQAIRGKWIWLVVLGIALIVLGTISGLGFPGKSPLWRPWPHLAH